MHCCLVCLLHFLPEKDVVVFPILGHTEAFVKSVTKLRFVIVAIQLHTPSVLVRFGEEPGSIHEIFASEVLGNLLVPEGNVTLAIVQNRSKFA